MEIRRESIFVSSVRSFFSGFAVIFGLLLAVMLIVFLIIFFVGPSTYPKGTEIVILPDAEGKRELLSEKAPVILNIPIHGIIGMDHLTGEDFEQILLDSQLGYFKEGRVKGIILHVDTPGGTVDDSDSIYRSLLAYKKKFNIPVYAFVEGMCASGGMYISAAADKTYATPASIIGSVGVIVGPMFNFVGTMDKLGVESLTFTDGKDKDMLNSFRPWKPDEGASIKEIVESLYQMFVTIVTEHRPGLSKEKLINEYGAKVFIAQKAQEYGYIDNGNSDYKSTLKDLLQAAGIAEGTEYQVAQLKLPTSIFAELAKGQSPLVTGKIKHSVNIEPLNLHSELAGKYLFLHQ